ncbi:MmgE/PrpD family protein [Pigmentiphaga aceris]|uniref:MmgE/PrpD family protein n=1 Tax=Pigmentiphaga aceris TaxID=1940612 RepID=A0A5C0ARD0_9BURK|nr:MmgE/PrpD family protein [Pigmentiphaga aceris]QEI04475.1 MmgE/PrpD family protein [Pigmentiphaga aceris]
MPSGNGLKAECTVIKAATMVSAGIGLSPDARQKAEVASRLAHYIATLRRDQLSPHTIDIALCCILDLLGAAAAALDDAGVQAARRAALPLYGPGPIDIWFTGLTGSTGAALLANSTAAAALDLDDGYRPARGHPGAAVIPAALSMLSAERAPDPTADALLVAVVAGYEIGARMSMGRPAYTPSGAWSPYAVIATLGSLHATPAATIAHALGIAGQTAPALPGLAGIVGSDIKEAIPAGVTAGYCALRLAEAGVTGPAAMLDDEALFIRAPILAGLGETPLIDGTYFKPFGCCRHIHAALDALIQLRQEHGFAPEDIARIDVHTYRATFNLANRPQPLDLIDAQYSVPHCLAVCAWHGGDALLPLRAAHLRNADVNDLARRVVVHHDADIEPLFPARSPARISVTLRDARCLHSPLTDPRGDPARPLSWTALIAKFVTASAHGLSPSHQQAVIDGVMQLGRGRLTPLRQALARRASGG